MLEGIDPGLREQPPQRREQVDLLSLGELGRESATSAAARMASVSTAPPLRRSFGGHQLPQDRHQSVEGGTRATAPQVDGRRVLGELHPIREDRVRQRRQGGVLSHGLGATSPQHVEVRALALDPHVLARRQVAEGHRVDQLGGTPNLPSESQRRRHVPAEEGRVDVVVPCRGRLQPRSARLDDLLADPAALIRMSVRVLPG